MSDKPERDDYSLKPDGLIDYQDAVIDWQEKEIKALEICYRSYGEYIKKLKQRIVELSESLDLLRAGACTFCSTKMSSEEMVHKQVKTIMKLRDALEKIADPNLLITSLDHHLMEVSRTALQECFGVDSER